MLSSPTEPSVAPVPRVSTAQPDLPRRLKWLAALTLLLALCFILPLWDLVGFALHSQLYSHILLIPFITAYLLWLKKGEAGTRSTASPYNPTDCRRRRKETLISALFFLSAAVSLGIHFWLHHSGNAVPLQDHLALTTFSFLSSLIGLCIFLLGATILKPLFFPLAFLIFMVPFPIFIERGMETALQNASAAAAHVFLSLSGMPVLRNGTDFRLPGFSMQVAPECSGIHSTLVLVITSLLAGYLLLSKSWPRFIFALAVLPLGIFRNGFRIFLLGQLCVHVNPDWINSDLHHRGGPIFFALSLIPFFLLLWWLRKWENKKPKPQLLNNQNSNAQIS
jgi:exosortase C (VPDSG-CTERM-specific)